MTENRDAAQPLSDLTAVNPCYPALVSAGTAVLWTTDPHGNFVEPQTPWTSYTGQDWAAHCGSGWLNAVHPDDRQRVITLWSAALKHGSTYEARGRIWHEASQSYRYFVSRAVPVADGDGGIREWVGSLTDVDELARAEAAQREYGALSAFAADVGAALVQRDPLPGVLQRCAASIVLHLGATFARIWTLNDDLQVLELQASAGLYTYIDGPHSRIPIGRYKIGLIAAERKPHLTNEVVGDARVHDQQWAKDIGLVAFAGYPLLVDDRLVGVMAMFARHRLSVTTIDALAAVANSVAIGIDRKRAEERLGEQALVRALTEAHGGSVDAGSAGLGKGATFTVRLPLLTPSDPQRAMPAASVPAGHITGMRALVVDDDADARELLAMTLESAGAIPLLASSVREALRLLEQERPDLLLADLAMPEEDGLDLIRIVRALPEEGGGRVPAIAVTAYASGAERDKALRAGYDAHVAKPYDTEALLAAIANVIARSRT
jgi:CheY-like chemotaxis protein